jgi:phage baseplate assembly protein V
MNPHDDPDALSNLIRLGVVHELIGASVIVSIGEILTPPLPWLSLSGGWNLWAPPSVGSQVVVFSPDGDIEAGFIINGLYSNLFSAHEAGPNFKLTAPDSALFEYDTAAHQLMINLASGIAKLIASGGFEITGPVKITGNLDVTGNINATEDIKAGNISLKTHKHGGVTTGAITNLTSEPKS